MSTMLSKCKFWGVKLLAWDEWRLAIKLLHFRAHQTTVDLPIASLSKIRSEFGNNLLLCLCHIESYQTPYRVLNRSPLHLHMYVQRYILFSGIWQGSSIARTGTRKTHMCSKLQTLLVNTTWRV